MVFVLCLVPLAILLWRGFHNDLTANPIEFITHTTGDWTLRFLADHARDHPSAENPSPAAC